MKITGDRTNGFTYNFEDSSGYDDWNDLVTRISDIKEGNELSFNLSIYLARNLVGMPNYPLCGA